ncbi:PHD-finger family protein [Wuchereria bancrofti]|uniref:PHD-finger family protein n=1 Tax=Wuchereria bancrofti TaxID=6293 RepID=J9E1K0_WUCBA|nr:PHD-finger family protein [Wuchereria bancrofti]
MLDRKRKSIAGRKDKKKLKEDSWSQKSTASVSAPFQPFLDAPSVMEMPVDPNEPTYCICHQVSHGQMIMCDNKQCPIEWFHFQCVGLTEAPKGKWYCERCNEQRKKRIPLEILSSVVRYFVVVNKKHLTMLSAHYTHCSKFIRPFGLMKRAPAAYETDESFKLRL